MIRETFQARQTPYKPRSNGKVGTSLRHYTQDQVSTLSLHFLQVIREISLGREFTWPLRGLCLHGGRAMAALIPISTGRLTRLFFIFQMWQIDYFIREEGVALRAFGYDPVSQNFPKARPPHSKSLSALLALP